MADRGCIRFARCSAEDTCSWGSVLARRSNKTYVESLGVCCTHCRAADDAEFVIRAHAVEVTEPADWQLFEAACREAGVNLEADGPAFELMIERVDTTEWEHCGQPDTRPIRDRWTSHTG